MSSIQISINIVGLYAEGDFSRMLILANDI